MTCRINADIRSDEAVVADSDHGLIKHREVEIGKEPLTHMYLLPIVAIERLVDKNLVIGNASEQVLQNLQAFFTFRWSQGIILPDDVLDSIQLFQQLSISGRIEFARQQFLFFRPGFLKLTS